MSSVRESKWIFLMLLLLSLCRTVPCSACRADKILCENRIWCISMSSVCDGSYHCNDHSDERSCEAWNNGGCGPRRALCKEGVTSTCVPMEEYCSGTSRRCTGTVDPRICQMLKNRKLQRLEDVVLPPTTPAPTQATPPPLDNLLESETQGQMLKDTFNISLSHPDCPKPYTRIGDNCLSLLYILKVGWGEARAICEVIDGQLVSFADDAKIFILLTKHLRDNGLTADFWTGGRYTNDTEGWKWITGSSVGLGSPYWAVRYTNVCLQRHGVIATPYWLNKTACYHYQQAPEPNTTDMCTAITYRHYYYMTDEDCMTLKSPLCIYTGSFNSSVPTTQSVQ